MLKLRPPRTDFDRDWPKYDGKPVVFQPSRMTTDQLQEGFHWANHQFYSLPLHLVPPFRHEAAFYRTGEMNREFRKLVKRSCPKGTLSPLATVLKNLQAKLPEGMTGDDQPTPSSWSSHSSVH